MFASRLLTKVTKPTSKSDTRIGLSSFLVSATSVSSSSISSILAALDLVKGFHRSESFLEENKKLFCISSNFRKYEVSPTFWLIASTMAKASLPLSTPLL
uniref:Uncharacterized protein n=1 Tax=Opuntia streptacantha TaxID=393608 RepID=A0A7C9DZ45_OPUST